MIGLRSPLEIVFTIALIGAAIGNGLLLQRIATIEQPQDSRFLPQGAADAALAGTQTGNAQTSTANRTPLASYRATLERPLFETDRRPWAPKPPAPPVAQPSPAPQVAKRETLWPIDARLVGIHIDRDNKRALFRTGAEASGAWIDIGREVFGWVVDDIGFNHVTINNGVSSKRLPLYVEK